MRWLFRKIAWSRVVRIVPDGLTYLGLRPRHKPPSFVGSISRSVRLREIAIAQGLDFPIWRLDDKLAGRRFAEELGLRVPELYALGSLEECVAEVVRRGSGVIKPLQRHSAQGVVVLTSREKGLYDHIRKRQIQATELNEYVRSCQVGDEATMMAEEVIFRPGSSDIPSFEWKLYCFGGEVGLMTQGDRDTDGRGRRILQFRRPDFTAVRTPWARGYHRVLNMPQAVHSSRLIEYAETYASKAGVDFVRVDLYEDDRGPIYSEITPHPSAGFSYSLNYLGRELDRQMGRMWEEAEIRLAADSLDRIREHE